MWISLILTPFWVYLADSLVNNTCCLVGEEYSALKEFYDDTNGRYWLWSEPISEYGNTWNFTTTNSSLSCPCTDRWQGVTCSFSNTSCSVTSLVLSSKNLTGTIPDCVANLSSLQYLKLNINSLVGTIPNATANMTNLIQLVLNNNQLTQTIPAFLSDLALLQNLYLNSNLLTGSIPTSLGLLKDLKTLSLQTNSLSRAIPEELCYLPLTSLQLSNNLLTGSIPVCVGNLTAATSFGINGNDIGSTIPESLCSMRSLNTFSAYTTLLSGTLPYCMGQMTSFKTISLMSTFFTSTIPESLGNLSALTNFNVRVSLLSGSVPKSFGKLSKVTTLEMQANLLSGSLPTEMNNMTSLSQFYIFANFLTGPIEHVFNGSHQHDLTQIQLNNNAFTGPLPYSIFGKLSLVAFVASVNCLHGSIPESICNSTNLNVLAMDGASSQTSCQKSIFPASFGVSTYVLDSHLSGTLPKCLFTMPQLEILQLSGNNIQSRLDDSIEVSDSLYTLVLSHNLLTGSVPTSIQRRPWTNLDLSYNKLTGVLDSGFHSQISNSSVSLNINRLSGDVPASLNSMKNITVLDGNIFYCNTDKTDIPLNDGDYIQYECGSNFFDDIAIAFAVIAFCLVVFSYLKWYRWLLDVLATFNTVELIPADALFQTIRRQCLAITAIILVFLLPLYGGLRSTYSTYTHLYAWTASATYLAGVVPGWSLLAAWCCFYMILLFRSPYSYAPSIRSTAILVNDKEPQSRYHRLQSLLLLLFNFGVVATVNGVFVYISITYATVEVAFASIGLAFFKLAWTRLLLFVFARRKLLTRKMEFIYWPRAALLIVNNLAIPILATAIVDTSCFYNAFVAAASITINIVYTGCINNVCSGNTCTCAATQPNTIIITYPPPFNYDYQCSSSVITIYAPVFAIVLLEGVLQPIRSAVVTLMNPYLLRIYSKKRPVLYLLIKYVFFDDLTRPISDDEKSRVVNSDAIMVVIINHFTILLTWGVVFPPLSIIACLAIWVRSVHIQVAIATKWQEAEDTEVRKRITAECAALIAYGKHATVPMISVACILCGLTVFDTFGDIGGLIPANTGALIMFLFPLACYTAWMRFLAYLRLRRVKQAESNVSVELRKTDTEKDEGVTTNEMWVDVS